jgi:CrcB protein
MNNLLLVFLGGGIGSISRYGISFFVKSYFNNSFPFATLISNVLSTLILALALGVFSEKVAESQGLRMLIVIGFCGGFSTFSTFSFETVELIRSGNTLFAIANILISVASCVAIIYVLTKQNTI